MSKKDGNILDPSLTNKQNNAPPALEDLSEHDKPWDKHKKHSETIATYYSSDREFISKGEKVTYCSDLLDFR